MRHAKCVPRDASGSLGSLAAADTTNNEEEVEAQDGRPEEGARSELLGGASPCTLQGLNWPLSEARAEATRGNKK